MGKLNKAIQVRSAGHIQTTIIKDDCDKFFAPDRHKAGRIKKFPETVDEILGSKPRIKAAPTTDVFYT